MTHLSIPIPDNVRATLEDRALKAGHPSVESYVAALIEEDAAMIDYGAPDHLRVDSREQLLSLVLEGLQGPTLQKTSQDWDNLRSSLISRHRHLSTK